MKSTLVSASVEHSFIKNIQTGSEYQLLEFIDSYCRFSSGIKRLEGETDHSFPCCVDANRQLLLHLHSAVLPSMLGA